MGKRRGGGRCSGPGCARNMEENVFFSRDSEAAFGSESATRGGLFWTRIRWGKAVAAPGVRGQDAREKWKTRKLHFFSGIQRQRLGAKVSRGGSFWTRISWGKAVAAPHVRGQDAR